jgi:hypothetical protein
VRKCRHCRAEIPQKKQRDRFQAAGFCSLGHMAEHGKAKARQQKEQAWRKEKAERKKKLRTKSGAAKAAQKAFNAWVRLRDRDFPCVSCGRHHQGKYNAGHYRSVGAAPELRFEPLNVHKQCEPCNSHLSGNIVEYRIELARRIGQKNLDWLEGPHEPARHTIEQLDEIAAHYRAECRRMERDSVNKT